MSRIIIWYRTDLRLHDHEPLDQVCRQQAAVIPVYCFDPRQFGLTSYGFAKTGSFRTQFLLESILQLRQSLQNIGCDLVIRRGYPEQVIPKLAQDFQCKAVYFHEEAATEEKTVEAALITQLDQQGTSWTRFWGHTLFDPGDLPFEINRLPELFTRFRKQVEQTCHPRPLIQTPQSLSGLPKDLIPGDLPSFSDLNVDPPQFDDRALFHCKGGELSGQARLQDYIWIQDRLKVYKETRNGMLNPNDASRLSPWLALGCLSPRFVYGQVQQYEQERIQNDSTYWLIFELLWRDYFRLITLKHGHRLFQATGLQGVPIPWKEDWDRFDQWCRGQTGFPLVDANMQELAATGFMSNRGRQNVASFLTKNLGIHWHMGAEWFESVLIDYDPCSNWGNWNYTAGVGNDARGFRYFNIPKQSRDYDPQGDYVKHWLPVLKLIPGAKVHEPYRLTAAEQSQYQVRLGVDYPNPIVDLVKSVRVNEKIYNEALAYS